MKRAVTFITEDQSLVEYIVPWSRNATNHLRVVTHSPGPVRALDGSVRALGGPVRMLGGPVCAQVALESCISVHTDVQELNINVGGTVS